MDRIAWTEKNGVKVTGQEKQEKELTESKRIANYKKYMKVSSAVFARLSVALMACLALSSGAVASMKGGPPTTNGTGGGGAEYPLPYFNDAQVNGGTPPKPGYDALTCSELITDEDTDIDRVFSKSPKTKLVPNDDRGFDSYFVLSGDPDTLSFPTPVTTQMGLWKRNTPRGRETRIFGTKNNLALEISKGKVYYQYLMRFHTYQDDDMIHGATMSGPVYSVTVP